MNNSRTALLVRCSKHEAAAIRDRAEIERRTISNFVLNIVVRAVEIEETMEGRWVSSPSFRERSRDLYKDSQRKVRPRTALLVRCSTEEAERIRAAARRKQVAISEYVLYCVKRSFGGSLPDGFFSEQD